MFKSTSEHVYLQLKDNKNDLIGPFDRCQIIEDAVILEFSNNLPIPYDILYKNRLRGTIKSSNQTIYDGYFDVEALKKKSIVLNLRRDEKVDSRNIKAAWQDNEVTISVDSQELIKLNEVEAQALGMECLGALTIASKLKVCNNS